MSVRRPHAVPVRLGDHEDVGVGVDTVAARAVDHDFAVSRHLDLVFDSLADEEGGEYPAFE